MYCNTIGASSYCTIKQSLKLVVYLCYYFKTAVKCGDPPKFHDGTKCGGIKLNPGEKRCDWNDLREDYGGDPEYNTNITYECPEG